MSLLFSIVACSNSPELETGEIRTLQLLKQAIVGSKQRNVFIDARTILSRKQIDAIDAPILLVELASGQNGTLTVYPGQGVGKTWLGADGATITLDGGILKASRGMGDDLMGSSSSIPPWPKITKKFNIYSREMSYINGNNEINTLVFNCKINKNNDDEIIEVWDVKFRVTNFEEKCTSNDFQMKNVYYVDERYIVRRSRQYHSDTIGYIKTERLDR